MNKSDTFITILMGKVPKEEDAMTKWHELEQLGTSKGHQMNGLLDKKLHRWWTFSEWQSFTKTIAFLSSQNYHRFYWFI